MYSISADSGQSFGVDNDAVAGDGNSATGQPGTAASGDYFQAQFANSLNEFRQLFFTRRPDYCHRQEESPVGGICGVADKGEGIETDIISADDCTELFLHLLTLIRSLGNFFFQFPESVMAQPDQAEHFGASF